MRISGGIAALALLASCSGSIVPRAAEGVAPPAARPVAAKPVAATPAPAAAADAANARTVSLVAGPGLGSLNVTAAQALAAFGAFKISCPSLLRRADNSGLTRAADWKPACDAAKSEGDASGFFARWFEPVQVADGRAFATGYYEPEIAGSREARPGYAPVYRKPPDLVDVDLGLFSDDLQGKRIRGRMERNMLVPYHDRAAIEDGALSGRGLELAYAVDPVELFFLQVQGSGRLRLPNGSVLRIGYDGQNGRDYTGIGGLLRTRGLLAPGQASMQGIMAWLRANPAEGRALMRENRSWVFFKELTGAGPLGALGLPVTGRATIAADPKFVPLGAPVFLSLDRTDATGLWIAQDTGGAIKGPNRFDTFWGAGDEARAIAGGMSARGTAVLLLPTGTLARIQAEDARARTPAQP